MPLTSARRQANLLISTILVVGLCLAIATWSMIASVMESERRVAIAHATAEANNLSAAFHDEVLHTLDTISMTADIIAKHMQSQQNFDLYTWSQQVPLMGEPTITGAAIIRPDGTVGSSTLGPSNPPIKLRDRWYFRHALSAPDSEMVVGHTMVGRLSGHWIIPIARRVTAPNGRLIGVISFGFNPDKLTLLNQSVDLGTTGTLTLLGDDRTVRAQFGPDNTHGRAAIGSIVAPLPPIPASGDTPVSIIRVDPQTHRRLLLSIRRIAKYKLLVSVGYDMKEILQPVQARDWEMAGVGATFTVVLSGLLAVLIVDIRRRSRHEAELTKDKLDLTAEIERRKAVEAQLRQSEERMRDFAEMASDWFWEQDADFRFMPVGPGSPGFNGPPGASHYGKTRWDLYDPGRGTEKWVAHRAAVEAHQSFRDFTYDVQANNGHIVRISASGKPVFDAAGTFVGYRGTGRDLTREMEAEAAILAAKNRAEQAESLLRDAVASISEGFLIFDREDRLVLSNEASRGILSAESGAFAPGATFRELVQAGLDEGAYPEAVGREADWLEWRVTQHQEGSASLEVQIGSDHWVLATDRRMANGGIAALRVDITALKRVQAALRDSETRLERAQDIAGICPWELDLATGGYFWSQPMYRLCGLPETFTPTAESVMLYVHPDDRVQKQRWLSDIAAGIKRDTLEYRIARPDGTIRLIRCDAEAVSGFNGIIAKIVGATQDITERRSIEQRLLQAQKMDAIGSLSGGLAHDFNNLLGVIIGNLHLLSEQLQEPSGAAELCDDALGAARRGADLVRRLLAFGRRQALRPQPTDINRLVTEVAHLLSRMIGEDIDLRLNLAAELQPTVVDPVQLEAALTNLIANARDAMPNGGRLTIGTRILRVEEDDATRHGDLPAGDYMLIEVADSGSGMPPDVVARVFEPFFTTKEHGKGTGLGLSMVFGFMKQSGGHVSAYSEVGRGTTLRLYIPYRHESTRPAPHTSPRQPLYGQESILLVEDNPDMLRITSRQLADLGYTVTTTASAIEAMAALEQNPVALLLTDVVMPGEIDGFELARRVALRHPNVRILLMSGFPAGRFQRGDVGSNFRLISKPFDRDELGSAIREVLDGRMAEHPRAPDGEWSLKC